MQRKVSLGLSIAVVVVAVILSGFGSVMAYKTWTAPTVAIQSDNGSTDPSQTEEVSLTDKLAEIRTMIDLYNIREFDEEDLENYAMYGYVAGIGDPYAEYLDS